MLRNVFIRKNRAMKQARRLRGDMTGAEKVLWQFLCKKKLGYKFRRQTALGKYIVDFCCVQRRLIVEVDGSVHRFKRKRDLERTLYLQKHGFHLIRFTNDRVLYDPENVLRIITLFLTAPRTTPSIPVPDTLSSPSGGRGGLSAPQPRPV